MSDETGTIPALWHYTCPHGRIRIGKRGSLRPGLDGLVWLTDLDVAHRDALGLSMTLIDCDRTAYRYRVLDGALVIPWTRARRLLDPVRVDAIESTPGVLVRHWFVCPTPVRAELDEPVGG